MKKNCISKVILLLIVICVLFPFWPYKSLFVFSGKSYSKIKVRYSVSEGYELEDDCPELGLKAFDTVSDYIEENYSLHNDVTLYKYEPFPNKLTLYGSFVNDENGKIKFCVQKWSSGYIALIETNLWSTIYKSIYHLYIIPIIILLIIIHLFIRVRRKFNSNLK